MKPIKATIYKEISCQTEIHQNGFCLSSDDEDCSQPPNKKLKKNHCTIDTQTNNSALFSNIQSNGSLSIFPVTNGVASESLADKTTPDENTQNLLRKSLKRIKRKVCKR